MNSSCPADIAAEAEFHLTVAKQKLGWILALASAIDLDLEHGLGKRSRDLAGLATYLSDTGFGSMDEEIEAFRKIAEPDLDQQDSVSIDRSVEVCK